MKTGKIVTATIFIELTAHNILYTLHKKSPISHFEKQSFRWSDHNFPSVTAVHKYIWCVQDQ